jgi:DNA gyrase/topoisomerase IV subunit A
MHFCIYPSKITSLGNLNCSPDKNQSTNIPPHNLGEVCDALVYVTRHWARREKITVDDLMAFIPGPDFPTGGVAYRYRVETASGAGGQGEEVLVDTIRDAYQTGRERIVTQARLDLEQIGGGKADIVVTELPYAVQKSTVMDRIAKEVAKGRVEGVSDLRDESDYTGMRLMVEVARGHDPQQVLAALLAHTQLRETFGVINRALVLREGEPVPEMLSFREPELVVRFVFIDDLRRPSDLRLWFGAKGVKAEFGRAALNLLRERGFEGVSLRENGRGT